LNNLIRHTINLKDGTTSNLNGYVRNVLARFAPGGDRFNVPRFMWHELRIAMDDGRKGLPYAPYLMFMTERVTGYKLRRMVSTPSTRLKRPKPQVLAGP
jgi:hypothetical protein